MLTLTAANLLGCKNGPKINFGSGGEKAKVLIETPDGDVDEVLVESSSNKHSKTGVQFLRTEDWSKAAEHLTKAVKDDAEDHCSQFALGVAYEKLKRYDEAITAYKAAHRLKDMVAYEDGWRRVQDKKG